MNEVALQSGVASTVDRHPCADRRNRQSRDRLAQRTTASCCFGLIVLVLLVLGASFPSPALAQTIRPAQYIKTRLAANAREQKAIAEALKAIRKRGQDTLSPYIRGTSPVQVLNSAAAILEEERRTLAYVKTIVDGKPLGGDPRANVRQATSDGVRAFNQSKYAGQQQAEAGETLLRLAQRPGLQNAVEYQRVIIGLQTHVATAAQHFEETMDVYLSALGGPSIAETLEARRTYNARVEMQQRARRAREEEAAAKVMDSIGGAVAELFTALAETVVERNNVVTTDVGTGWRGARDVFQADGLDEGALLRRIHDGDFGSLAGDLRVHFALESYVVRFSDMCGPYLPQNRVELVTIHTEEVVQKNLLGMELSRTTVGQQTERSGIYASPEFASALLARNMGDTASILATLFGGSSDSVPILGGTAKLARMSARLRRDFRRLIARHGCDGTVLTRISDNLLRYAQQQRPFGN
jgi:hypothetical protein